MKSAWKKVQLARIPSKGLPWFVLSALVAGFALLGGPVPLAHAATFTVNSTADAVDANPGDGVCATAGGECTLRAAIMEANALSGADTITLPTNIYTLSIGGAGEDAAATGDLDITDTTGSLTFIGDAAGTTIIDAASLDRVFDVFAGVTLNISGVTITGGSVPGPGPSGLGGGIHSDGGTVTISDSILSANTAGNGGGIFNRAGTVEIKDSTITDNSSDFGGGGIYNEFLGSEPNLTITNSTVSGNSANNIGGGINNQGGVVSIANSTLANNSADDGGGMRNVNGGKVTIINSTLSGNTASAGGGIYNSFDGTVNINNCTLSGNTATGTFPKGGGGIYNDGGTVTFNGSTLSGNVSVSDGGGIFNLNTGMVTISNSFILSNSASSGGGGIANRFGGTANVTNSTVSGNTGNGIFTGGGSTLIVTNSAIVNNNGVGIRTDGGTNTINSSTVSGNTGLGIFSAGAVTLIDSTVSDNTGGGLFNFPSSVVTLINSTVSGNTGALFGGGIANRGGTLTVINSTVSGNTAIERGGGIDNDGGTVDLKNTVLAGNNAGTFGPDCSLAIGSSGYNLIGSTSGCTLTPTTGDLTNTDPLLGPLEDNGGPTETHALLPGSQAIDAGNPAGCKDDEGNLLATDQRGVARPQGAACDMGAFELARGPWYVATTGDDSNDCTSPANPCASINGAIGNASAGDTIFVAIGTYTDTGDEVALFNNDAILSGGWDETFTTQLGMSTIDGEGSRQGIRVNPDATATVERFAFQNGVRGFTNFGTLAVNNSTVSGNTNTNAAGILNGDGATLTLNNSTVSGNVVPGGAGGGIFNNGTLTLNNSTVSGNSAGTGGGIFNGTKFPTSLILNNSTVSANSAVSGGGIWNGAGVGTVTLRNTVLAGNTASLTGPDCGSGSTTSAGFNLIGDTSGCFVTPITGDLTNIDPLLGPLQDNGGPTETHALLPNSPAIDAGNPAGCKDGDGTLLAADQRGVARPQGVACDIGAFELIGDATPLVNPVNGHFYEAVAVSGGIDWFDARDAAELQSFLGVQGHLVTITSAQEDNFIATNFPEAFPVIPSPRPAGCEVPTTVENTCGYPYWFGGFQPPGSLDEPEGDWEWVTGEPFVYTNWHDGEPNDFEGREEDCLDPHPDGSLWNDAECDDRRAGGYVVEYDVPPLIHVSSGSGGNAGGVAFKDEDILAYDTGSGTWSMVFDGSDVGVGGEDVNGFLLLSDGSILMTFYDPFSLSGVGEIDDSDIVQFFPTSLGPSTAGSFSLFFDGSDVGLSRGDEDIDAIGAAPDGRLVISTRGPFGVSGASGRDEDLLVFNATSFGPSTSGSWELYFDGSDVQLGDEDIRGTWIDPASNEIYLTLRNEFSVAGASGDGADIFTCAPGSLGSNTSCTFSSFWDGSANGFGGENTDGISIGSDANIDVPGAEPTPTNTPVPPTATNTPLPPTPTDTPVPPTPTNTPTAVSSVGLIYVSSGSGGNAGGVAFKDEDILAYDTGSGTWSMVFDGSDVGVGGEDVNGFLLLNDGSILLTFYDPFSLSGVGEIDDSDIVQFFPTSLGTNTAGSFSLFFDGSDVGLSSGDEDIDAIGTAPDGRLVISTRGPFDVSGASGRDEDLLVFTATSFGSSTSGNWELYFDGSDVQLGDEDIRGTWIDPASNEIYLTLRNEFSVAGASGDGADIFTCDPGSLGSSTSCSYSFFWDGSANGFGGENTDGISKPSGVPCGLVEDFDTDPGWTRFNNPANDNDFGFRNSNLAGGTAGEAGGFFSTTNVPVWYGDGSVGAFGGSDALCASGILNIRSVDPGYDGNVLVGHFDNGEFSDGQQNGIGLQVLEQGATSFRIFYLAGTREGQLFVIEGLNLTRTWSYNYDPKAGDFGSLTVSISGPGGGTATHFLASDERDSIGNFETFGLAVKPHGFDRTAQAEMYVDNLRYTSSVP